MNNDFHQPRTIFEVLGDLEAPDLDVVPQAKAKEEPKTNGVHHTITTVSAIEN